MSIHQRRLFAVLVPALVVVALVAPGVAADPVTDPTGVLASDNLKLHTTLPNPAAVGARFRGDKMYVTTLTGLTIYDISKPTAPVEVGRLPLPHFENEDVDLGGNILLISNDAAESYGILHIVDIANPAAPRLLTSYQMGSNPAGPIVDAADFFDVAPEQGNPGHTASCILDCRFAWVTDAGGMRVIDLRNPSSPATLGTFSTPAAGSLGITHDVQMDENGIAWISGYGGVAGYGIGPDYEQRLLDAAAQGKLTELHAQLIVAQTDASGHSRYGDTFGLDDGSTYNDFIHHNSRRLADSDVVYVTEEDYSRPGCRGAGSFETWRLPMRDVVQADGAVTKEVTGEPMTPIDKWETELLAGTAQPAAMCSAHYFDVLGNVVAQAWYEQGLRLLDVSDPANIRQIGYFIPPQGVGWSAYFAPTDPTGRVLYFLDASMGVAVMEYDRPTEGPLAMPKDEEPVKECKPKKNPKAQGGCKDPKPKDPKPGGTGRASSEAYEPTVVAPVRPEWRTSAPAGAPSTRFGYACRVSL